MRHVETLQPALGRKEIKQNSFELTEQDWRDVERAEWEGMHEKIFPSANRLIIPKRKRHTNRAVKVKTNL